MKFGKDRKVIFSSLTKSEAKAYINFLRKEIDRHSVALDEADLNILLSPAEAPFWGSAVLRHEDDIKDIETLIASTKHWFSLEEL